jgi:sulfur relay (sulfurtransferase) DsrF/TusC family protein
MMTKSVVIICEDSPIGKNSAIEAIRMGAGIMVLGDLDACKIIFMGDSVYLLNKSFNPESLNMDSMDNIFHMLELSDIEVFVLDAALEIAGLSDKDIIEFDNVKIASMKEISRYILKADFTYRY